MKRGNRKLQAAWGLTAIATLMLVLPTFTTSLCGALGISFVWNLIPPSMWAMVVTLVWGGYFTANVTEKHTAFMPDAEFNKMLGDDY